MAHVWQEKPEPIVDFAGEEAADVVIVGAGLAGCCAAQAAEEAGASVIVIEKFNQPYGHGMDVGAVDSVVQKRLGVEIDHLDAARLIYAWSQQQANYHLIRTFIERSGEVMTHYVEMAEAKGYTVRLNTDATARADWNDLDDRFRMFQTAHFFDIPEGSDLPFSPWNVDYLLRVAYEDAVARGARFMFDTPAEQLVLEGGRVAGVAVPDGSGGHLLVRAGKGVIMATGGIGDNDEMVECFCPMAKSVDKNAYFPKGGNGGDGHIMCAWAGAAFSRCYPAPIIHPVNFTVLGPGINSSWLTVDRDGRRFMNETAYEPIITNARLNAPGNVAWAVWDSDYLEHYRKAEPIKAAALPENVAEEVEACVEKGEYKKADTIAGLAGEIGVPADALKATVARYNELVDAGDDVDFGVPERFLSPCRRGPFYASRINAELLALLYGMRVDNNSQVRAAADDEPIPGLYAVGAVQGDFFANSYPVTVPGADHGRAMTFGYLVGSALAKGENIDGSAAQ